LARYNARVVARVLLAVCLIFAGAARAQPVDVAIVLAVDSSGSINSREFALQREGYARALTDPRVLNAIASGPRGAIALALFEWSGPMFNTLVVPWKRIASPADAEAVAAVLRSTPRSIFGGGTAVGAAIATAANFFPDSGFDATRRVIDVSGDGATNRGPPAEPARDVAVAAGITINGLPILGAEPYVDNYYRESVIGGPDAFLIVARDYDDFARAVLEKLYRELRISAR
jgi:hypothetical protein